MNDHLIVEISADILIAMMKNPSIDYKSEDLPAIAANHAKALVEAASAQQIDKSH